MRKDFYLTEKLGPKQSMTPEGFLLCEDVPIGRTGVQVYLGDETPIPGGPDGMVRIHRDADEVFRPEFMASLTGKPIGIQHPQDQDLQWNVRPENWRDYARGVVQNVRRGTGIQDDLLLADLLICDIEAIAQVRSKNLPEVSIGYNAEWEETGPGEGRQYNMLGNHVALVEYGRCGSRCGIGDRRPISQGDFSMQMRANDKAADKGTGKKVEAWYDGLSDSIRKLFAAKDEKGLEELLKKEKPVTDEETAGAGGDPLNIHVHAGGEGKASKFTDEMHQGNLDQNAAEHAQFAKDIAALKAKAGMTDDDAGEAAETKTALAEEAPPDVKDKAMVAKDSAFMEGSFQEAVAGAEILVPGITMPVFDRAIAPAKTLKQVCDFRRKVLDRANLNAEGRDIIEAINGRALALDGMSCSAVRTLFRASVAMKKEKNNGGNAGANDSRIEENNEHVGQIMNVADWNRANKAFWDKRDSAAG